MNFSQYVKGNALEVSNTKINIRELVSFLRSNTHITKLSLKWAGIDAEDAKELAKLTHLTELDLWHNNIDDKGVEVLANSNLAHLTSLNLRWNRVGKKGIEALANGNLINLTELDLRWNGNSEKGAGLAAKHVLTSLKKRHIEEKLKEESQSKVRKMEERHQTELTRLIEENQSRVKEIEERHQTEMTALRGKNHPDSKLGEVQPISRDQSLSSSRSGDRSA
ncbi:MAG: hypothetical protein LBJ80_00855 [Rickettsiales bacterium]|jgi:Leucine-rich repeat (LRR) protein|nr:hypothetical protein [Rickettsiales bacterium]MDR1260961.1 hypothetical protein [Rickettsiales bacterium]